MANMRFLLINRFFGGEQTPTGRMLKDVAQELRRQGHEVEVLASRASYAGSNGEIPGNGQDIKVRHVGEIGRGRLLDWTSFWVRASFSLASRRWDRCLLLTDPPFLPFAAWLTHLFRAPEQRIYWWTMDVYPEALVAAGMAKEGGFLCHCLRWLNELGLRRTNGVIALGGRQLQRLQTYRRWNPAPDFAIIAPPWDLRPIHRVEVSANKVLRRLSCPGFKVALYTGNLGEGHLFAPFLDAARFLHEQGRLDWLFVFVVRGAGRPGLEATAARLPNVRVLDYLPESETPDLLWSATVHLVSMKPGWEGVIVPSKLYGALQTSAPVLFLGPLDADTAAELQATGRGLSLPPTAPGQEVARALENLADAAWLREPHMDTNSPRRVVGCITR